MKVNLGPRYMNVNIPDDWTVKSIDECCSILDSKRVPLNFLDRDLAPGEIPYYGATGRVGWIDDYLFEEELVLVGEDGAPFLNQFKNTAYIICFGYINRNLKASFFWSI